MFSLLSRSEFSFNWQSSYEQYQGRLLLSCLQFLFNRNKINRRITQNSFQLFQFQWANMEVRPQELELIGEKIDEIANLLRPLIRQEPHENPQLSMTFLEMIALLVDGVSHVVKYTILKGRFFSFDQWPKMLIKSVSQRRT